MSTEIAQRDVRPIDITRTWTTESLKEEINRERELRDVVITYYRESMIEGHHYYRLDGDGKKKPALSKEGALNLCSLFKVRPEPEHPVETLTADGHYMVRYRVNLISLRTGEVVAIGDGLCTTRESKYAYRWVFDRDIPIDVDKSKLAQTEGTSKYGKTYVRYKLPNQDLANEYNTVLKMSEKRAMVDGVLKLPLASELFTQDLEETLTEGTPGKDAEDRRRPVVPEPQEQTELTPNHPTRDQVESLIQLARSCDVDLISFGQHMRQLMELSQETKVTKKFLSESMTQGQFEEAWQHYNDLLRTLVEEQVRADVGGDGEPPTPETSGTPESMGDEMTDHTSPDARESSTADEQTSLNSTEPAAAEDASASRLAPVSAEEGIYASKVTVDTVVDLAPEVGEDAVKKVQHLMAQHGGRLPQKDAEELTTEFRQRQAVKAKAAKKG